MRPSHKVLIVATCGFELMWLVGQFARDCRLWTGLLFYLPSVFLVLCLLATSFLLWRKKFRTTASFCGALVLPPLLSILWIENHWRHITIPENSQRKFRLAHWNVCRGYLGWERVRSELRDLDADIYVLSEVPKHLDARSLAEQIGDNYRAARFSSMGVIARGEIIGVEPLAETKKLDVHQITWKHADQKVALFCVDLSSSLRVARDPLLNEVMHLMKERSPDLVVGDFNAPRRSRALWPLPDGFSHAYEAAGSGWSYTWPVPLPMLAIDQCIVRRGVSPTAYELRSTTASDHRLQVLDFTTK